MIIILEGPDCAGKTTLAKQLQTRLRWSDDNATIVHFGPPSSQYRNSKNPQWAEYSASIGAWLDRQTEDTLILDRFMYGELIYGPVLRRSTNLTRSHVRMLERILLSMEAVLVYCRPPIDVVELVWRERVETELIKDIDLLQRVCLDYDDLMMWSGLPQVSYDFTRDITVETLRQIELMKPPKNRGPGYGHFKPGVTLMIGEQNNLDTCFRDCPFVAPGESSLWLAQNLEKISVDESQLYWINALDHNGNETDRSFIDKLKPGRIITLGEAARIWCSKREIPNIPVQHPAYWKRFQAGKPYPLLEILK